MQIEDIKVFPEFEPLEIQHKDLIESYYKENYTRVSELNFTEMFMWRKIRNIRVTVLNGNICICLTKKNKKYFFPPLGTNLMYETVKELLTWFKKQGEIGEIYGFDEEQISVVEFNKGDFVFEETRDDADYIYLYEVMAELKGRKFHGKRNHISSFKKNNDFTFEPLEIKNRDECINFQREWFKKKACEEDHSLKNENEAVIEILTNWDKLSAFGGVLRVNGKVEGYTVGEVSNKDTAIVIAEKANHEIKGIYQVLNNLFCTERLSKYKYVNREQDTGHEGIRRAKMSYYPDHFVFKKIVKLAK